MGYEVLLGDSCFTSSEAQKLSAQVSRKSDARVRRISGRWLYYAELEGGSDGRGPGDSLGRVKELVQASSLQHSETSLPRPLDGGGRTFVFYITPRNTPSPWSSKATSIAQVCGLGARIERGRIVTIELEGSFEGGTTSFRDVLHDRMTESLAETLPEPAPMFAEGARGELLVVDIFADARGPLEALRDYNKATGLGLDRPDMEYLVEQYRALGRSPVRGHYYYYYYYYCCCCCCSREVFMWRIGC